MSHAYTCTISFLRVYMLPNTCSTTYNSKSHCVYGDHVAWPYVQPHSQPSNFTWIRGPTYCHVL